MMVLNYKKKCLLAVNMVVVGLLAGCDQSGKASHTTQTPQTI